MFCLLVCFHEPEIHVCSAGHFRENVGGAGILKLGGEVNGFADRFALESDGMSEFRDMLMTAGDVEGILGQARRLCRCSNRALCNATELNDAFCDDVHIHGGVCVDLVEEFVQRDEVRSFHIPVGLLGLHHEIDGISETCLQKCCYFDTRLFREAVSGMRELCFH